MPNKDSPSPARCITFGEHRQLSFVLYSSVSPVDLGYSVVVLLWQELRHNLSPTVITNHFLLISNLDQNLVNAMTRRLSFTMGDDNEHSWYTGYE